MATTITSACINTLSKTDRLHIRLHNTGIKKRKGIHYAIRSRDSLRRTNDEGKFDESKVYDYMDLQPEITVESRADVISWVTIIHNEYNLFDETLYLTINIIDRFLAAEVVRESELRVIGITALFIASKYIQVQGSEDAYGFVEYISVLAYDDPSYERQRIFDTEKRILMRLDWRLSLPTLYTFITRVIKAVEKPLETKIENMVYFYAELGMMNYEIISKFDLLMVATSAIYGACATLKKIDVYDMLKKQIGFKELPILDCAKMIGVAHSRAKHDEQLKVIYEKYSSETRDAVAFYTPADVLLRPVFTLTRKVKV